MCKFHSSTTSRWFVFFSPESQPSRILFTKGYRWNLARCITWVLWFIYIIKMVFNMYLSNHSWNTQLCSPNTSRWQPHTHFIHSVNHSIVLHTFDTFPQLWHCPTHIWYITSTIALLHTHLIHSLNCGIDTHTFDTFPQTSYFSTLIWYLPSNVVFLHTHLIPSLN